MHRRRKHPRMNLLWKHHPWSCLRWHPLRVGRRRVWDPGRCHLWDRREEDRELCHRWVGRRRVWDQERCHRWGHREVGRRRAWDQVRCHRWGHREADPRRAWDQVRCHRWLLRRVGRRQADQMRCRRWHPLLLLTMTDRRRSHHLPPCHRPIPRPRHHCHPLLLSHRATTMRRRRMNRSQTSRRSARPNHQLAPLRSVRWSHPPPPLRSRPSHPRRAHLHQLLLPSPGWMHPENWIWTHGTHHSIRSGARRRACTNISAGR